MTLAVGAVLVVCGLLLVLAVVPGLVFGVSMIVDSAGSEEMFAVLGLALGGLVAGAAAVLGVLLAVIGWLSVTGLARGRSSEPPVVRNGVRRLNWAGLVAVLTGLTVAGLPVLGAAGMGLAGLHVASVGLFLAGLVLVVAGGMLATAARADG